MDWLRTLKKGGRLSRKYACALLVLLLGIGLMLFPKHTEMVETVEPETTAVEYSLEESLEAILSQIDGAGKVQVLLTVAQGTETVYQTDTAETADSVKVETVIVTDAGKAQQGLIRQVNPEIYLGAVVVCQGGGSSAVQLAITKAVSAATGLTADKITVLKMK